MDWCSSLFQQVGPVAQRLEQWTHNPLVQGSNPCGPTKIRAVQINTAAFAPRR